jgi:hypothetical protein
MLKRHLAFIALLVALVFSLGMVLGVFLPRVAGLSGTPKIFSSAALLQQVKTLSDLVTVQYVIEKVVILDDVKWVPGLGENRVLLVAHGIVKAGLDMGKLEPSCLAVSGRRITVKLPPVQITDVYLDEKQTRVVERSTGLLRFFDKDLEQNARQQAVDEIRLAARKSGILKDAEERARIQLKNLFEGLGYEVRFE